MRSPHWSGPNLDASKIFTLSFPSQKCPGWITTLLGSNRRGPWSRRDFLAWMLEGGLTFLRLFCLSRSSCAATSRKEFWLAIDLTSSQAESPSEKSIPAKASMVAFETNSLTRLPMTSLGTPCDVSNSARFSWTFFLPPPFKGQNLKPRTLRWSTSFILVMGSIGWPLTVASMLDLICVCTTQEAATSMTLSLLGIHKMCAFAWKGLLIHLWVFSISPKQLMYPAVSHVWWFQEKTRGVTDNGLKQFHWSSMRSRLSLERSFREISWPNCWPSMANVHAVVTHKSGKSPCTMCCNVHPLLTAIVRITLEVGCLAETRMQSPWAGLRSWTTGFGVCDSNKYAGWQALNPNEKDSVENSIKKSSSRSGNPETAMYRESGNTLNCVAMYAIAVFAVQVRSTLHEISWPDSVFRKRISNMLGLKITKAGGQHWISEFHSTSKSSCKNLSKCFGRACGRALEKRTEMVSFWQPWEVTIQCPCSCLKMAIPPLQCDETFMFKSCSKVTFLVKKSVLACIGLAASETKGIVGDTSSSLLARFLTGEAVKAMDFNVLYPFCSTSWYMDKCNLQLLSFWNAPSIFDMLGKPWISNDNMLVLAICKKACQVEMTLPAILKAFPKSVGKWMVGEWPIAAKNSHGEIYLSQTWLSSRIKYVCNPLAFNNWKGMRCWDPYMAIAHLIWSDFWIILAARTSLWFLPVQLRSFSGRSSHVLNALRASSLGMRDSTSSLLILTWNASNDSMVGHVTPTNLTSDNDRACAFEISHVTSSAMKVPSHLSLWIGLTLWHGKTPLRTSFIPNNFPVVMRLRKSRWVANPLTFSANRTFTLRFPVISSVFRKMWPSGSFNPPWVPELLQGWQGGEEQPHEQFSKPMHCQTSSSSTFPQMTEGSSKFSSRIFCKSSFAVKTGSPNEKPQHRAVSSSPSTKTIVWWPKAWSAWPHPETPAKSSKLLSVPRSALGSRKTFALSPVASNLGLSSHLIWKFLSIKWDSTEIFAIQRGSTWIKAEVPQGFNLASKCPSPTIFMTWQWTWPPSNHKNDMAHDW